MKFSHKLSTIFLTGLVASFLPVNVLAQSNSYPVSTRAIFLAGCMTEEPDLNFERKNQVYSRMRTCVCLLDNFQATYDDIEFITLFERAARGDSASKKELDRFGKKYYHNCL